MAGIQRWADDQVHNDELIDIGPATIRGQALNAVRLYTIDYQKLEARNIGYIRENIAIRKHGTAKCSECGVPSYKHDEAQKTAITKHHWRVDILKNGQFADHDPKQGAAIDHSIATGEPLLG